MCLLPEDYFQRDTLRGCSRDASSLTHHHERELETSLDGLPVDLVGKIDKAHVVLWDLLWMEDRPK